MSYQYLFGPIQSRRLKASLGVDCIESKTCNLDCIYCECGQTTNKTMIRKEYVPASAIIGELKQFLSNKPKLDFITFGGSGEPTLNTKIGEIVSFLKKEYSAYKTALLTNGTLLYLSDVQDAIMAFDCILPSLDAISEDVFKAINRPDPSLDNNTIIEGLVSFSNRYTGTLLVEVFIIPGINDSTDELERFKDVLSRIAPTRVQLNSLDRPGTLENVPVAAIERLSEIARFLLPLPVEIIARSFSPSSMGAFSKDAEDRLLGSLKRRPMTLEEISVLAGVTVNSGAAIVERLSREGKVRPRIVNDRLFYAMGL